MEEPIHGDQREDIKQYLRRMERVMAQAEELHSHTVVQSNSSTRRSNFSRRMSYSGDGSCPEAPAGGKDTNPLRRSYCVATDGHREAAPKGESLPGRILAATGSRPAEALLDSGATLSDWMAEDADDRAQPGAHRLAVQAMEGQQTECTASQHSDDVLLDPEACLTFKIGSDGVPYSESDCDSVLIASPIRGASGGINQVQGTPQRRGPSTVASPLSRGYVTATASPAPSLPPEEFSPVRDSVVGGMFPSLIPLIAPACSASENKGCHKAPRQMSHFQNSSDAGGAEEQPAKFSPHSYPVTISANTFCASEQPSQSLSHFTGPAQSLLGPPTALTSLAAHAVSDTAETLRGEGDTADTADSGASEGDPFLTPEDSAQANASGASSGDPTLGQVSTGASQPPAQQPMTQQMTHPVPVSAAGTEELLGMQVGSTPDVAEVVRYLASASSSDVSRPADSAGASMGSLAPGMRLNCPVQHLPRKQATNAIHTVGNDLAVAETASATSPAVKATTDKVTPVDQSSADLSLRANGDLAAADRTEHKRASQGVKPEEGNMDPGERKRSALEKLKGRLRSRQRTAVSRSRQKLLGRSEDTGPPELLSAAPPTAAVEGPQPWPSQHMRSPLKSMSRPATPQEESPSRIPRPSSASSQPGSPRIRAMIPSRLPRPPTPATPRRQNPGSPACGAPTVQIACSPSRIPSISPEPPLAAPRPSDAAASRAASPRAAAAADGRPIAHQPSGLSRPGSARLDFQLTDDGALTFPGRQQGAVLRRTSAAELDSITSGSSPAASSSGCTSSNSARTVSSSQNGHRGRATSSSSSSSRVCTAESKAAAASAALASPKSVSSKAASQRARHVGASGAGRSISATSGRPAMDVPASLPSRPSTSPPQASRSTSSAAVNGELRSSGKQSTKIGPSYANVKPRTNSHLDLNYIPVAKNSRRHDATVPQTAAAKPAWGSGGSTAISGSSRSERAASTTADRSRDNCGGSTGRGITLHPSEKLPYDALLGHVTNLLSEVRTALRQ